MKKLVSLCLGLLLAGSLAACGSGDGSSGSGSSGTLEKISVGATPVPHEEILEFIKPQLEALGYELEIVPFTDYQLPNSSLAAGEIDANYFQHKPFLDTYNANNGTDLVSAGNVHFEPLGLYAGRTSTIEELPDGATIAIPSDPSNEARALNLLADQGLIELKEGVGLEATPLDIVSNPKNLQFEEMEAAQIPMSLPDVDMAVINGNYALGAGVIDKVVVTEALDSEAATQYINVVAVRKEDADSPKIQALMQALTSDETRAFIEETYGASVLPAF